MTFLSAIEDYRAEINPLDTLTLSSREDIEKLTPKELREQERIREEVMNAGDALNFIEDSTSARFDLKVLNAHMLSGLKEGVVRIVVTFGDSLSAFKFLPRTALKLQGYVEYSQ